MLPKFIPNSVRSSLCRKISIKKPISWYPLRICNSITSFHDHFFTNIALVKDTKKFYSTLEFEPNNPIFHNDKTQFVPESFCPMEEYIKNRKNVYFKIRKELHKDRLIMIGDLASICFENYELVWIQIQEMLYIENGGAEQINDEIEAYNPLLPKGNNLIFTLMLEIEDPVQRNKILSSLGYLEETLTLNFENQTIKAVSVDGDNFPRTNENGKTSAVHFLQFILTPEQKAIFINLDPQETRMKIKCSHPNYVNEILLAPNLIMSLKNDLLVKD